MGHFSNGSEGDGYRAALCDHCANDGDERAELGCAVWDAHLIYNSDQFTNPGMKAILDLLIPREGVFNGRCLMFRPRAQSPAAGRESTADDGREASPAPKDMK